MVKLILTFLFISSIATASYLGNTNIYDSSGNTLNSTSNALNTFLTNSSIAVTGTFFQATQPVSGTFWQTTQPVSGSLGRTWNLSSGSDSVAVTGTFWQTTQPVSLASAPLPTNAAQETGGNLAAIFARTPALGTAASSAAIPIVMSNALALVTTAFSSVTGIINTDMLTGSVSGWYDAAAFRGGSFSTDIYTTTTVTGGVITFETTDDTTNAAAGITMNLQDQTVITQTNVTTYSLVASTIKHYMAPIMKRYIRFRLSTAFAGTGSVGATINFSQIPYMPITMGVTQATSGSLNTNSTIASGTVTTVGSVTSSQSAIPGIIADVASAAIITTTTTATLTPTFGVGYIVQIPVTVVTGTLPTYQVTVQESADSGTNWANVYAFPTIITTGFYYSPPLFFRGNRVRYVQTLTGTSPSFTRAINRLQMSAVAAAPVNNNATFATGAISGVTTLTAPQDAVGFVLQTLDSNTTNLRWSIGTAATTTSGMQLEPGRDTGEVHSGQNVSICPESGTTTYMIQWIQQ